MTSCKANAIIPARNRHMETPILTIGIPTYNRPESIQRTVRALLPQLNEKVVLRVWDNCSDTPVSMLFSDEEKDKIQIERNRANIGGDANICGVIYHSDTKWVWDLGDDDYPLPNAVDTILNYINKYPEALFFKFNSYIERELHSFEDLADICSYQWIFGNFLFISSGVYNREKLIGDIQHYYVNLSSMVGQTIYILKHLEKTNDNSYFLSEKIVQHTPGGMDDNEYKEVVSWNALTFIERSAVMFDIFKHKRKTLNPTLFAGMANQYLNSLGGHGLNKVETYQALKLIFRKVGFVNILRYNIIAFFKLMAKLFLILVLPKEIYSKVKNKAKNSINKKIMDREKRRL